MTNRFNRSAIEREKQWAKWIMNDSTNTTPVRPPDSPDWQQPGDEDQTMNPMEKVDGVINTMNEIKSDIGNFVAEEKATSYREGFEAGKGAIVLPDSTNPDAQYTQQQMNDAVNSGKGEQRLADEAEFNGKVSELQTQIDGIPALVAAAKDEATSVAKAEFRELLRAQQTVETASEAELDSKLSQ